MEHSSDIVGTAMYLPCVTHTRRMAMVEGVDGIAILAGTGGIFGRHGGACMPL